MTGNLLPWPIGITNLRKLAQKKYRQKFGLYFLEGISVIEDTINAGIDIYGLLYSSPALEQKKSREILDEFESSGKRPVELSTKDLQTISGLTTPPNLIAIVKIPDPFIPDINDSRFILALDNISDPGNLGTIIRCAAFYGVKELWLSQGCAELYSPKVMRAAMSTHMHLNISDNMELGGALENYKEQGYHIVASVIDGQNSNLSKLNINKCILVLGNEAHGVCSEIIELADTAYGIKRVGNVDSLNVAMASAILLDRFLGR